jgi:hypothetical protein
MKSKIGSFIMTTAAAYLVLVLSAFAADGVWKPTTGAIQPPPASLYQDAHNGVTRDGSLVWNPAKGKWYGTKEQTVEQVAKLVYGNDTFTCDRNRPFNYVLHAPGAKDQQY